MKQFKKKRLYFSIFLEEEVSEEMLVHAVSLLEESATIGYTYYMNGNSKPIFRVSTKRETAEKALEMAMQPIFHVKKVAEEIRIAKQNEKAG